MGAAGRDFHDFNVYWSKRDDVEVVAFTARVEDGKVLVRLPSQDLQLKAKSLAQKALAYGMEGVRVDGMDVLAVREAAEKALAEMQKMKADPPEQTRPGYSVPLYASPAEKSLAELKSCFRAMAAMASASIRAASRSLSATWASPLA